MDDANRARLLDEAGDLFYRDGIAATGTARLASELAVSKQTLYSEFGSKDELVAAALAARDAPTLDFFVDNATRRSTDPAERLVALFAVLGETLHEPGFRGCRFLNASAELADPSHPARPVAAAHKRNLRAWMERTARAGGLRRPRALAAGLLMLFDGALADAVNVDVRPADLVDAARTLVDAARGEHRVA